MSGFVPGLGALQDTICGAAEAVLGHPPGRVLDLGGGPGVLTERFAQLWPAAAVTLMDIDPVLLALARHALGDRVCALDGDLSSPNWVTAAGGDHDLITAIMTLHYLPPGRVRACYAEACRLLTPGGLLIVADLMPDDDVPSVMRLLDPRPDEVAAGLVWAQWWSDLNTAPALQPLLAERAALFGGRPRRSSPPRSPGMSPRPGKRASARPASSGDPAGTQRWWPWPDQLCMHSQVAIRRY